MLGVDACYREEEPFLVVPEGAYLVLWEAACSEAYFLGADVAELHRNHLGWDRRQAWEAGMRHRPSFRGEEPWLYY